MKEAALSSLTPVKGCLHPSISYWKIGKPGSLALTWGKSEGGLNSLVPLGLSRRWQMQHTGQFSHLSFSVLSPLSQVLFPRVVPNLLCTQISVKVSVPGNLILGATVRDEVVTLVSDPFYLFQRCPLVIFPFMILETGLLSMSRPILFTWKVWKDTHWAANSRWGSNE